MLTVTTHLVLLFFALAFDTTASGRQRAVRPGDSLVVTHYAGSGAQGSADGDLMMAAFFGPGHIARDHAGNLYVSDGGNRTIRKISLTGVVTRFAGSTGVAGFRDGSASVALFGAPAGIAVDSNGNVFVADNGNHSVRKITPDGTVSTVAGSGAPGFGDGSGNAVRFNFPHDIVVDQHDDLYVADVLNQVIRKISPTGLVSTLAGKPGQRGSADGKGDLALFSDPSSLAVDADGNVWVGGNGVIRKITPDGEVSTVAGSPGAAGNADGLGSAARFMGPEGLAFSASGDLYIASGTIIQRMDKQFRVTTVAGIAGQAGDQEGTGSRALLAFPLGIVAASDSRIFIADGQNNRIYSAVSLAMR